MRRSARDGEEVIEARGAEVVSHALGETLVLAEDDAEHERTAHAGRLHALPPARPGRGCDLPGRGCRPDARSGAKHHHAGRRGSPAAPARRARRSRLRPCAARVTRTTVSRIAPRGGERPTGSRSRTRSRRCDSPNRLTSACTRTAHGVVRAGPVTTSSAGADSPISAASALCAHRLEPKAAPPQAGDRENGPDRDDATASGEESDGRQRDARPATATRRRPAETTLEAASPAQAEPTSSEGQCCSTTRLTGSRGRAAARSASARFRGPRPGRRPT